MITRDALANYLHAYLACDQFNDYAPNGLQVSGKDCIKTICTAVSATQESITQAIQMHADALMVHHGFFWRNEPLTLTGLKHRRIATLIKQDISLFAYHLPLDCHPALGNNAYLATLLNLKKIRKHAAAKTPDLLWSGTLSQPFTADEFTKHLTKIFNRTPLCIHGADKPIKKIAWCTGAAQDFIFDAAQLGVDAYLSGEISERTYHEARELGLYYFACGHHATERYGIAALGEHLSTHFGLNHYFFDSSNPV